MDVDGVFKYIQIRLSPTSTSLYSGEPVIIVRGYLDCPYHADILAKFVDTELEVD